MYTIGLLTYGIPLQWRCSQLCKSFKVCFFKTLSHAFKNSTGFNTKSIRLKDLVLIDHCTNHDPKLKILIHRHHSRRNECFIRVIFCMIIMQLLRFYTIICLLF